MTGAAPLRPPPDEGLPDMYPKASSIGEMVARVAEALEITPSLEMAQCVYCSILTDTGSFRYSNTSPAALRCAAQMVELGVSPWEMTMAVYESQPATRIIHGQLRTHPAFTPFRRNEVPELIQIPERIPERIAPQCR